MKVILPKDKPRQTVENENEEARSGDENAE